MKLQMSFGENLINLRKQKGWSQDDLANNLNLSRQAISKWENDTSKPDIDNIEKISKVFSVTIDDLLNNDVVKDKAVTLNVKKQEKKEKTITIVKCMIIAVIILYIINVIFKFASLLIIVNGIQKYANLSNYHYVIRTYGENGIEKKDECWFKDGVSKTIVTNNINSENESIQVKYFDFSNNYGVIEDNKQKNEIDVNNYLKTHLDFDKGTQLYSEFPIDLRKNDLLYLIKESTNVLIEITDNETITLKYDNKIIELQKETMLPKFFYAYNNDNSGYIIKTYVIKMDNVEKIEK